MENKIWTPQHEADLLKEYKSDLIEKSKSIDWGFKAMLQYKLEKGDYEDIEPVVRFTIKTLAYGK